MPRRRTNSNAAGTHTSISTASAKLIEAIKNVESAKTAFTLAQQAFNAAGARYNAAIEHEAEAHNAVADELNARRGQRHA